MKEIGTISNYFDHVNAAAIKLSSPLKVGDKIKVTGGETEFEQEVKSMQIERQPIKAAKAGQAIGLLAAQPVHEGAEVFKVTE